MAEIVEGKPTDDKKTIEAAAQALAPPDPGQPTPNPGAKESRDPFEDDEPPFRLPPLSAIAGVLIRDWVERKIGFEPEVSKVKQNL